MEKPLLEGEYLLKIAFFACEWISGMFLSGSMVKFENVMMRDHHAVDLVLLSQGHGRNRFRLENVN